MLSHFFSILQLAPYFKNVFKLSDHVCKGKLYKQISLLELNVCQDKTVWFILKGGVVITQNTPLVSV